MDVLDERQRRSVFSAVLQRIERHAVTPGAGDVDTRALREKHEPAVVGSSSLTAFEQALEAMLRDLRMSHTGFFHESRPRASGRIALAATFMKAETADGVRWMFQDVHAGGIAARAGINPGDVLLTVDGQECRPPVTPTLALGQSYRFAIRRTSGATFERQLDLPASHERQRPIIVPDQVVTASRVAPDTGLVKISMFPGVLGIDVARDISRAVAQLHCPTLIVDLRGNTGGGIGCLRVMSLFCADRRGVGYSVDAKMMRRGYTREELPRFDRIPASRIGAVPLAFRFGMTGRSVAVFSEGLGPQPHHGRVTVLVNEHAASAAEMVAGFASEYHLATVVGVKTAGRLVAASSFKVGYGYRVVLPVAAYFTWSGTNLEQVGVAPDIEVPLPPEALHAGDDPQLAKAVEHSSAIMKSA